MSQKALRRGVALLLLIAGSFALALPARAATNTVTGDISGVNADLDDSNTVTLTSQALALIKRAFLADGTAVASGANLPRGTVVKFLVYVNNNTAFPVSDVSAQDVLDPAFAYQLGTIKTNNAVLDCGVGCDSTEEAAIYAAVNGGAANTDAIDLGDTTSYSAGTLTVNAGNQSVANGQLNIAANRVWAMLFTVVMQ